MPTGTPDLSWVIELGRQLGITAAIFVVGLSRRWWVMGYQLKDAEAREVKAAEREERANQRTERWQMFSLEIIRTISKTASVTELATGMAETAVSLIASKKPTDQ